MTYSKAESPCHKTGANLTLESGMEINLNEIESLLSILKGGVSSKSNGFDLLYFAEDRLCTFNDEVAVSVKYKSLITALIPFNEFYSAVKKLAKGDRVATLEMTSPDTMLLKVRRAQITFNVLHDETAEERYSIPYEQLEKAKWQSLPENFADIITSAAACTSNSRNMYMLTCVYINRHDIFGADLTAAYWAEVPENLDTMAIAKQNVKYVANTNPDKYTCTDSFYHFLNSDYDCTISVRKVNGTYPDYKKFFGVKGTVINYTPAEAKNALDIATTLIDKGDNIKVTVKEARKDTYMILQGASAKGTSHTRFPVQVDSKSFPTFCTTPEVLKKCFEQADTFIVSDTVLECTLQDGGYVISLTQE